MEFERDIIQERTLAGQMAAMLCQDPNRTVREICEALGVSKATVYHYTAHLREPAYPPTSDEETKQARC